MKHIYHVTGINPEPWKASLAARGKTEINFYKEEKLKAYQLGLAEELPLQNGHVVKHPKDMALRIEFFLWRQLDGSDDKTQRANWADATNLQKSTEDALQDVLYHNDKHNRDVRCVVVEQHPDTQPHIIVVVSAFDAATARGEIAQYPRPTYSDKFKPNVEPNREELF